MLSAGGMFAHNNGPCYPKLDRIAEMRKEWDTLGPPLMKYGFGLCSNNNPVVEQALKEVATAAFNPILTGASNNTAVTDWKPIISKLEGLVRQL